MFEYIVAIIYKAKTTFWLINMSFILEQKKIPLEGYTSRHHYFQIIHNSSLAKMSASNNTIDKTPSPMFDIKWSSPTQDFSLPIVKDGVCRKYCQIQRKRSASTKKKQRYFGGCLKSMFSVCFQAKSECAPAKNGMIQQGHEFTFSKILDPPPFLGKFMFKKQC